uniref:Solute carrier family 13 member 4 n=1 Tax=Cyprinus carpio carpio TaxID=630221 RepID=A0A9J7XPR2_CYPCA
MSHLTNARARSVSLSSTCIFVFVVCWVHVKCCAQVHIFGRANRIWIFVLICRLTHMLSCCFESSCAYVLIVTAVYWVSEAVPLGAAALVPAFLYPLFGVLKSSEVASEYFKDTTLLLMGVICLAASIEKWNLHKRIALRMVMIAGAKPGMLVLGFMCCTVFLSMWLSNTSTTAMVMPIAEAVLQQLICTGIADSLEDSLTHNLLLTFLKSFFPIVPKQAPISIPAPPKKPKIRRDSLYPTKRDHMICKCLSLSITYAATIGGLITITGTSTNLIFAEQFNNRYPEAKVINFGTWFIFSLPIALIMLMLTWIWLHCLFLGCNFRETCSLSKKRKTRREILSEKRIHEEYHKLGPISYPEVVTGIFFILMTVLWFTREPGFVPGWTTLFEKKGYRTDATVSVLLGFLLFLIPARKPWPSAFSSESKEDPLAPMITWKDFQRLMPWEIVILVGGGYALAAGCKVSGLSMWIGRQLEPMSGLPPWAVTLLACLLVSAVTEFASNPATLTVFLPILSALSETLHINPLHTLIPATMCVSFGVMLPVGNPPNAIVFSYGHVQISDMVKAGFGVNLIGVFVVMLAIMTWGEPLFHLSEFPTWALMPNVTGSL